MDTLFDLENEIRQTVQQLKDDLTENEDMYDIADDSLNQPGPEPNHTEPAPDPSPEHVPSANPGLSVDTNKSGASSNNTNNTDFFTPHSVAHHHKRQAANDDARSLRSNISTVSNRSNKRAMFKAFLASKTDQTQTQGTNEERAAAVSHTKLLRSFLSSPASVQSSRDRVLIDDTDSVPAISAESKPEDFQKLLDELNQEMTHKIDELPRMEPVQVPINISPLSKPEVFQKLIDELPNEVTAASLHIDEDEIIDDQNSQTQQELSELYKEIDLTQQQFQHQLISVDKEFASMNKAKSAEHRVIAKRMEELGDRAQEHEQNEVDAEMAAKLSKLTVNFDDDREQEDRLQKLDRARSMHISPRAKHNHLSHPHARAMRAMSQTMGSPRADRDAIWESQSTGMSKRSSQTFQFGTGRELVWEKELKQRLLERDPLAVNLHRTLERMNASPRKLTKLKQMVERAQNPAECTFTPHTIALPAMYPQLCNVEQPFLHRQQQWVHNANKRLQYEQTKIRLKQEAECTFVPAINKGHFYLNQCNANLQMTTNGNQHTQGNATAQSTVSMKKRRLMQQMKEKKDEEFRKHCTFKPKLCKASKRIAKQGKDNRQFKQSTRVKIHADDDEMKECTFQPEINSTAPLRLKHVQEYVKEDAYKRLSTTLGLNAAMADQNGGSKHSESAAPTAVPMTKAERESAQRDFFTRMENAQEMRQHQMRQLRKQTDPSFQPRINRRSQALVNRSGLNFEDRQSLCLEHQGTKLQEHIANLTVDREESELRFKPELNEKSRSLVENKKIPRNPAGAGYSRANYYFHIRPKAEETQRRDSTEENERILSQPRLQKYLARGVVGRLSDVKTQKEILYSHAHAKAKGDGTAKEKTKAKGGVDELSASDRRLSEIELEDFIERQKQYETFRKKRIQKLWKRFNDDKDSDSEIEAPSPKVGYERLRTSTNSAKEEATMKVFNAIEEDDEIGLSYTQLFQEKTQSKDGSSTKSAKGNMSYSNLSKMANGVHCETQFVSMST